MLNNLGILSIDDMVINKKEKEKLLSHCVVDRGTVCSHLISKDGTRKFLISFNGDKIESMNKNEVT
jgi:adenine C2-methylase RlmN of 23S rRNA A2503 and tRNA A37